MNRTRHVPARALIAAALLLALVGVSPAAAALPQTIVAATDTCVDGRWQLSLPESLRYMQPQATAVLGGAPAWLAGFPISPSAAQRPQIARWQDDHWIESPVPFNSYGGFNGISAFSATRAWAVGSLNVDAPRPISARWDGAAWKAITVPRPSGQMASLVDVWSMTAGRAWAVGSRLFRGRTYPYALEFNGSRWLDRSPASLVTSDAALTAVSRSGAGHTWAVGYRSVDGKPQPWVVRRNGSSWVAYDSGLPVDGYGALLDITFVGRIGWAVGYREGADGQPVGVLLRWDKTRWQASPLPWTDSDEIMLRSVSASATTVAVSGARMANGQPHGVYATRNQAGQWTTSDLPSAPYPGSTVGSVAMTSAGPLFNGWVGEQATSFVPCTSTAGAPLRPSRPTSTGAAGSANVDDGGNATLSDRAAAPRSGALTDVGDIGVVAQERTAEAGLEMTLRTFSGVTTDFNSDGWPDVFVNGHLEPPRLMLGGADGFHDAAAVFPENDRHGCAAADVDLDARADLYCTVGQGMGTQARPHMLLLAVGHEASPASHAQAPWNGFSRGQRATFLNLDGDEWPDLYTSTKTRRTDGMPSFNRLYRNVGGEYFESAAGAGIDGSLGGECLVAADLEPDGDDDLLVCATEPSATLGLGLRLFVNDGGHFTDRTAELGLTPMGDEDVAVADFDGDGALDIAQLTTRRLRISRWDGARYSMMFETALSSGVALAIGDVNGDGATDIYVAARTGANDDHVLLVNDGTGLQFGSMPIPQPLCCSADDVLALDYDLNGLTDFVLLNGRSRPGPVKLTAFFPAVD